MKSFIPFILWGIGLLGLGGCARDAAPVPTDGPRKYTLTVLGGTGGGIYEAEREVAIKSDAPIGDSVFAYWQGDTSFLQSAMAVETQLIMPAQDVLLQAVYQAIATATKYPLTIVNGTGSGEYAQNDSVTIFANTPPADHRFSGWYGGADVLADSTSAVTWLYMPARALTLTAEYVPIVRYALTVTGGSGSGTYEENDTVMIIADAPSAGYHFVGWTGGDDLLNDPQAPETWFQMPARELTLTASFEPLPSYTLTVENGTGSGSYLEGDTVPINAQHAPVGERFIYWGGATQYVEAYRDTGTFVVMPDEDITVSSLFRADTLPFVSYLLDVEPLFQVHCYGCHYSGGNYSDLTDYDVVYDYRSDIKSYIETEYMPPAPMPAHQRDLIITWINQGALED